LLHVQLLAWCHSKVKSQAAEGLLPEFDLGKKVR
jgi:hypothetical protein